MTLAERIVELHRRLGRRRIPHAFGGAVALAFWTHEPRGTRDIDLNLFVPASDADHGLAALSPGVTVPPDAADVIARDGQMRLWWDDTPVDVFFDYMPVHEQAHRNLKMVPFAGSRIPVLGPVELAVFKAMFDRTRDWADIEAMLAAETLDVSAVRRTLSQLIDEDDQRFTRLDDAVHRAAEDQRPLSR